MIIQQSFLKIPYRVSFCIKNVPLYIYPECNKKINNYRGAHGNKRYVDKIFSYGRCGNTHFFANGGANPKNMPFNKIFKPVHTAKIK
jgi:hypothetical protein